MTQSSSHTAPPQNARKDRFGISAAACGLLLYIAATVFFVLPLEQKMDTFVMVSYLFVPAIIGGLLYERISRTRGWE